MHPVHEPVKKKKISPFQLGCDCGPVTDGPRIAFVPTHLVSLALGTFFPSSLILSKAAPVCGGNVSPNPFSENSSMPSSTFFLLSHKVIEFCSNGQHH
jgi:hypothetical protein